MVQSNLNYIDPQGLGWVLQVIKSLDDEKYEY